jgi:hypothetical protein
MKNIILALTLCASISYAASTKETPAVTPAAPAEAVKKAKCEKVTRYDWDRANQKCQEPFIKDADKAKIPAEVYEAVCKCAADKIIYDLSCNEQGKMTDPKALKKIITPIAAECMKAATAKK